MAPEDPFAKTDLSFVQDLPVTNHNTIYAGISPSRFAGSLKGKVVFITGASRGIGEATAHAFAQCGADLFLASRKMETMERVKADLLKSFPEAKIGTYVTDVVLHENVRDAVEACIKEFGKIDIVISNSGAADRVGKIHEQDPDAWWRLWEVNVKGSFNVAHYTLVHLAKTKGYLIFVSSVGAQLLIPGMSSYQSGKHALNRIAEFAAQEHAEDGVKVFSFHPGSVKTEMGRDIGDWIQQYLTDDVRLASWTMVRLVSGSEDYLSGRFVSCSWDLDEVADKFKEGILRDNALKNRLALPREAY